jgi:Pvc16 N-terminal domain
MKEDAIQRVSDAISERLKTALGAANVFVGPPDADHADQASIIVFPYRLVANQSLRNTQRVLPPASADPHGEQTVYENSIPFDVFYLITPGTMGIEPQVALGKAIRELQRDPNLVGAAVDGDTVRLSLEPATTDELSRIWALFPNKNYRTSVVYLASPVWIDPADSTQGTRVVDDLQHVGQKVA